MSRCWYADPKERPHFRELCSIMDQLLSQFADYTELVMVLTEEQVEDQPGQPGMIRSSIVLLRAQCLALVVYTYIHGCILI